MRKQTRAALLRATATSLREEIESIEAELATDELPEQRMVELAEQLDRLVAGTGSVSGDLVGARQQPEAETLLVPLLGAAGRDSSQSSIEEALDAVEQGTTREFNVALARWLSHRSTETFVRYAPKLDAGELDDGAAVELGEILGRLWREAEAGEVDATADAIAQMGQLCRRGAGIEVERLGAEVRASFEVSIVDQVAAEELRPRVERLENLVAENLLSDGEGADVLVEAATRALREPLPAGRAPTVGSALVELLDWAPFDASEERMEEALEALEASPWIEAQPPFAQILRLQVEAGMGRDGLPESPYDVDELADLAETHEADFVPGVALWLDRFEPEPTAAARVLRPYLDGRLPTSLDAAVDAYSSNLDATGRFRLVEGMLQSPFSDGRPKPAILRRLGIEGADPEQVTVSIVDRFERSHSNPEREAALAVWRAFAPTGAKHRKQLVRRVFIPLCGKSVGGYELCRKYLDLCRRPPRGTKNELLDALGAAPDKKRLDKMRLRMKEVGLKPLPKG